MAIAKKLTNKSSIKEKLDDLFSPDVIPNLMAKADGLIPTIIGSFLTGSSVPSAAAAPMLKAMLPILRDMVVQGKLKLPAGATNASDFKPEHAELVKSALKEILTNAGQPNLDLMSTAAVEIFKKTIDACGADVNATKIEGLNLTKKRQSNGDEYDVILYFVEQDANGPKLPLVDGSRDDALSALEDGFMSWARKLKLDIGPVSKQEEANLIITGQHLGDATTTLAKGDVGPPRGRQLRMVFNLSKSFDVNTFEACAAHEFGHILGVCHEHVPMNDKTLLMYHTNLGVRKPKPADLAAAVKLGWREKPQV